MVGMVQPKYALPFTALAVEGAAPLAQRVVVLKS